METAQGVVTVVTANMAKAIRVISVQRGHDPRGYTLVAFGGAGPLHGARLARELDIGRVLVPRAPGILCALGLLLTDLRADFATSRLDALDGDVLPKIAEAFDGLAAQADVWFAEERLAPEARQVRRTIDMRYAGQNYELPIALPDGPLDAGTSDRLATVFAEAHRRQYGFAAPEDPVQLVTYRLEASGQTAKARFVAEPDAGIDAAAAVDGHASGLVPRGRRMDHDPGLRPRQAARRQRDRGPRGDRPDGRDDTGAARHAGHGRSLAQPDSDTEVRMPMADAAAPALDPITVEVISSSFASITEEMGEALVRASHSTNIKERRDCSTALFDAQGRALCQAEHIPIHLGSFIGFIPYIMEHSPPGSILPGDVFIGNDPYAGGGTHLPDIVLAEPIFHDGILIGWAINTAHHADFADRGHAHIYQEGLRIPPIRLYREGRLIEEVQQLILTNCQIPKERLSDLRAQMASNRLGVQRMGELCTRYGADVVRTAGEALLDYAERKMRAGISAIPDGTYRFSEVFDCDELAEDLELSVEIRVAGDEMRLDFDGPPQLRSGFNVVHTALLSTVFYAVKCVVDPTILPNAGLARPITVNAPEGHGAQLRPSRPRSTAGMAPASGWPT